MVVVAAGELKTDDVSPTSSICYFAANRKIHQQKTPDIRQQQTAILAHIIIMSDEWSKFLHEPQVFACGLNTASQLDCASSPEPLNSFKHNISKISCGKTHCLAVSNTGELWSWGSGMGWKLGRGSTHDAISAQQVTNCERGSINTLGHHHQQQQQHAHQNHGNNSHSMMCHHENENSNNNNNIPSNRHHNHSHSGHNRLQYNNHTTNDISGIRNRKRNNSSSASGGYNSNGSSSLSSDALFNRTTYTVHVTSVDHQKREQREQREQQQQPLTKRQKLSNPSSSSKNDDEQQNGEHENENQNDENNDGANVTVNITLNSSLPKVRDVACGEHHSVCVDIDGIVYTWGLGREGQLGTPSNTHHSAIPRAIDPFYFNYEKVIKVAANSCFSMAITDCGSLYSWGWGGMFRLGHGNENTCNVPTKVESLNNVWINSVSCGWRHTCCISNQGHVYSWGDNSRGQLGHGDLHTRKLPQIISQFVKTPAQQVSCGAFFTLVLTRENVVYGFGNASSGELASEYLFSLGCQPVPQVLESVMLQSKLVSHISAGTDHACAVSVTGNVFCWGSNEYSQLGNESISGDEIVFIPNLVTSDQPFQKAYCGATFTMFMTEPTPSIQISELALVKDFQSLMNTEGSCDVALITADGTVLAHKAILCARSSVLRNLIAQKESANNSNDTVPTSTSPSSSPSSSWHYYGQEEQISIIELDLTHFGIGHFELKAIVEYIYTGSLQFNKFVMGNNLAGERLPERIRHCSSSLGLHSLSAVCTQLSSRTQNYTNFKIVDVRRLQLDMTNFVGDASADFTIYVHRCDPYSSSMQHSDVSDWAQQHHNEDTATVYRAHLSILVARSEHFKTLIHANMMEAQNKELHLYDIRCPEHFLVVLQFLYSDREDLVLQYLDREDRDIFSDNRREVRVFEVLALADSLLLPRLKQICEVFIEQNFGAPTEQLKEFASQFQANQLLVYSEFYMRKNKSSPMDEQWPELVTPMTPLRLNSRQKMHIPGMVMGSNELNLSMTDDLHHHDDEDEDEQEESEMYHETSELTEEEEDRKEAQERQEDGDSPGMQTDSELHDSSSMEDTNDTDDNPEDDNSADVADHMNPEEENQVGWSALTKSKKRMLGKQWRKWLNQYSEQRFRDKVKDLRRRQTWNKVSGFVWGLVKKVVLSAFLVVFYLPFLLVTTMYGWFLRSQTFDFDAPPPDRKQE